MILGQSDLRDAFISWPWVGDHLDDVWTRTVEHLQLTLAALAVGFAISLALSLVAIRWRWTYGPITWFGSVLYTIPSIALFGLLIPVTGLGFTTALIALVSYTILIFVRNIVAGIDAVPPAVVDAADAMGFTRFRKLWAVELPIALPTIITGVRIASVTVIGLVTLAAAVGSGGYGALIFDGLRRNFSTPVVLGAGLSVLLATVVDVALVLVQRAATPWARRRSLP